MGDMHDDRVEQAHKDERAAILRFIRRCRDEETRYSAPTSNVLTVHGDLIARITDGEHHVASNVRGGYSTAEIDELRSRAEDAERKLAALTAILAGTPPEAARLDRTRSTDKDMLGALGRKT